MRRGLTVMVCCLLLTGMATPAAGQEPERGAGLDRDSARVAELPPEIAERLVAFFNDPETIHLSGRSRVPAERVIVGDVAVLGGPFTIAGRVEGRVAVINGDVELQPGALVTGDLLVVGGQITGAEDGTVGGEIAAYSSPLRYRRLGESIVYAGSAIPRDTREGPRRDGPFERTDFLVATGQSYNRVEGLPITFGPVIRTASSNPLLVRALAIYRSESGLTLDPDRLGYYVRAEQFLGGTMSYRVGATVHSLIDPIEDWHVSDLENGLATFLLRRDFRDHYQRRGWSAFVAAEPRGLPISLTLEGRWDDHRSRAAGSPWTLFRNADPWRPQPLVAEGKLGSVAVQGVFDTRSSADDPSWGWYVQGEVERSVRTDLVRPETVPAAPLGILPPDRTRLPQERVDGFTAGFLDLRRYNRVSPVSRLNFRLLMGGSLDGSPLPPQRQHALGGEGSLPGYELFGVDCGARSTRVQRTDEISGEPLSGGDLPRVYHPSYGCDGFALFQTEYRGKLTLRVNWGGDPWGRDGERDRSEERGWELGWSASPDWVVFVDAGRGWAIDRPGTEDLAVDLGFGLAISRVGIYAAVPLTGGGGVNVFARLGPRF
jgi:hypothetical protein